MLLLVVGLVVLVLVIVVVVFLSVRSMRTDDDDHPVRPARRPSAERESFGREPARREPAGAGRVPRRGADPDPGYANDEYQGASLPRPRDFAHDQDPHDHSDGRREPMRRRPRPVSRVAEGRDRGGRGAAGGDWSDDDWGGVSDEQYWAEMSSDKPLATTARSAQAGPPATQGGATAALEDLGDRGAAGGSTFPARREPARSMASAATSTVGPRRQPRGGRDSGDALRDEPYRDDSYRDTGPFRAAPAGPGDRFDAPDTDPGLGSRGGWGRADEPAPGGWDAQDSPTAAWSVQDAAPDTRTGSWGAGQDQAATQGWAAQDLPAEDPLTSPSFSAQDGYSPDARSYRSSHDRVQTPHEPVADRYDSGYGQANGNGYGGHTNGSHTNSSHTNSGGWSGYAPGGLEPLPEPGGSAAGPAETWHSAPVPTDRVPTDRVPTDSQPGYTEPGTSGWDHLGSQYQDTGYGYSEPDSYAPSSRHGQPGRDREDWSAASSQSWPDAEPRGWSDPGYGSSATYPQANGYGHNGYDPADQDADYGPRGRHGQRTDPGYSSGYEGGRG